ncbi:MAG: undecaprenyldiphospho-muramoylpentapeptide beta-N-acetylglucosaminyltransferase [Actinomycetia bacterium]|nr:undecaprenyldiphospho-muramoylpentapeptide beta-N-acetylglucosaminyltransferase [Actinomycetes bacterium]
MTNVVLAGGGTTGHVGPMIATAQALVRAEAGIGLTCLGTPKGLENTLVPAAGLDLRLIPAVPLPRRIGPDLLRVPFRLRHAIRAARDILTDVRADVVAGFGGYAALPVCLAARGLRLPVVVHEQNAVPGLANKVAARFARATLTAFPGTPLPGAEFVGLPVRDALAELAASGREAARPAARAAFGLRDDRPVLLVSGGSQGAKRLNDAALDARAGLLAAGLQILHVWGPKNYPGDATVVDDPVSGGRYVPLAYVEAMEQAYAAADLMLARAGAGTVVETALVGLPALLVPLPIGNGEQARNADALVRAGADEVIPDATLNGAVLLDRVPALLAVAAELARRGEAARAVMQPGAADRVAARILKEVNHDGAR